MAIGIRVYNSQEKSASDRATRDIFCARCGATEESINHVFFECSAARQVWALSQISSNPAIFSLVLSSQIWIIYSREFTHQFAWILWYIWKGKNSKVFCNLDIDPKETLKFVETESILWAESTSIEHTENNTSCRGFESTINSRALVFYRWFLER